MSSASTSRHARRTPRSKLCTLSLGGRETRSGRSPSLEGRPFLRCRYPNSHSHAQQDSLKRLRLIKEATIWYCTWRRTNISLQYLFFNILYFSCQCINQHGVVVSIEMNVLDQSFLVNVTFVGHRQLYLNMNISSNKVFFETSQHCTTRSEKNDKVRKRWLILERFNK